MFITGFYWAEKASAGSADPHALLGASATWGCAGDQRDKVTPGLSPPWAHRQQAWGCPDATQVALVHSPTAGPRP